MCRSKKSTNVVQPRNRNRNHQQHRSSSSSSSAPPSTAINNPSSSTSDVPITESRSYVFNNTSNNNKNWSKSSSISSHASLSSLKDSLPENPHIYHFSEISDATGNFSGHRLSNSSWRCSIRNKDVVVFQRKFRRHMDLPELRDRLVVICRSHHSSLVKLLGASISGNYIYLVYEFIPGASLADCLRNRRNPNFTELSTWISRMQIAADLAHGLDYIHNFSGSDSGFVHNHIKSSSIVIAEENLGAKICHFGTSELCGEAVAGPGIASGSDSGQRLRRSGSRKVKLEGARGYMAPEFQNSGVATQKTDVYAFGVVVLELLSGEEALKFQFDGGEDGDGGYRRVSVVDTARAAMEEHGGVRKWVDKRLRDSFPVQVAEKMIRVGLECLGEDPIARPDMGQVAVELSKLYLESKKWAESMGTNIDLSVSFAPR